MVYLSGLYLTIVSRNNFILHWLILRCTFLSEYPLVHVDQFHIGPTDIAKYISQNIFVMLYVAFESKFEIPFLDISFHFQPCLTSPTILSVFIYLLTIGQSTQGVIHFFYGWPLKLQFNNCRLGGTLLFSFLPTFKSFFYCGGLRHFLTN